MLIIAHRAYQPLKDCRSHKSLYRHSSANVRGWIINSRRSAVHNRNRIDPRTEPCGIPCSWCSVELVADTRINWKRPLKANPVIDNSIKTVYLQPSQQGVAGNNVKRSWQILQQCQQAKLTEFRAGQLDVWAQYDSERGSLSKMMPSVCRLSAVWKPGDASRVG